MDQFLVGVTFGALLCFVVLRLVARRQAPAAAPSPPAPQAPPAPDHDPLTQRLYELQQRVAGSPRPSTPDEMFDRPPFVELVDVLSRPPADERLLQRYVQGEDAILAWASLAALAGRPRDATLEERLLRRLNDFNPWTRHFMLRVLEAWNPDDRGLAGRVLLRLDESWTGPDNGILLEDFLTRRAGIGPPSLAGLEPPPGFDGRALRAILLRHADPAQAGPLLEELEDLAVAPPAGPSLQPPAFPLAEASLSDVGRLTRPGGATDAGLLACPSADAQLERVLAAVTGTPRRSLLIVGEAGVGKTTLARRAAAGLSREGWTLFEAGASQLNAGMMFTGAVEQRLQSICRRLARDRHVLWLIPDFHQLLWSGRHMHSPTGLLEMLLPAIESGEVLVLGETRSAALERLLAEHPEVARVFEIVRLEPPPEPEVAAMVDAWAADTARGPGIEVPAATRREAVALARQYMAMLSPPGGVLQLLKGATAAITRSQGPPDADRPLQLTTDHLVEALARLTGLPLDILDERRSFDLEALRARFETRVVGQPEAVRCLVERLALLKAGVTDPGRPTGVFLFAGGSGTGKTELAKTLAEYLFGSPDRLLRVDMSELQDAHALERLLGSTQESGAHGRSLADRVRRQPFCVVLLDEFERAHPRVWDVFLQVFDDGRLTDHRGNTADFRQAIIILTSNLGSASAGEVRLGLVDGGDGYSPTSVERAVQRTFRPELLNRLDRLIVFRPLTRDIMRQILRKELADAFDRRGLRRRDWAIELEESAIQLLIEQGFSPTLGARPLQRSVERLLLTPLAAAIVDRSAPEGDQFLFVRADGDRLAVEFVDPDAPAETDVGAMAPAPAAPGLASLVFESQGSPVEVHALRAALADLQAQVTHEPWAGTKEALLLESAAPGFWERADRFERLGRAEYMDRIEGSLRSAASLLERLEGDSRGHRLAYPREMVRRLAQQLYLVEAAAREALETGPRDAFVLIEPAHEDAAAPGAGGEFARRIEEMYVGWARARGMRLAELGPLAGAEPSPRVLAIAGFAAYALLAPEQGLHVLESDERGPGARRRATVRVRIEPQPPVPARDGRAALREQATRAFSSRGPLPTTVVRRYREVPAPLVRDHVRGWRTGRIERVLAGDFDVIPVRTEGGARPGREPVTGAGD